LLCRARVKRFRFLTANRPPSHLIAGDINAQYCSSQRNADGRPCADYAAIFRRAHLSRCDGDDPWHVQLAYAAFGFNPVADGSQGCNVRHPIGWHGDGCVHDGTWLHDWRHSAITVAGVTPTGYNGTFNCTVTTSTNFTYALSGSLAAGTGGVYTPEDVSELVAMATTFFAQGSGQSCYVLELGAGNATDGATALQAYITANPNSNYVAGATGYFYAYVVPRTWDGNATFLAMLASYESTTAKTYFFITTTLATYTSYTNLMKCAFTMIESPSLGVYPANALTAATYSGGFVTATTTTSHGVVPGNWFTIAGCTPAGYNGTFLALAGTTGNTLVYALSSNPGAETILGTLVANLYANSAIPSTEFSIASAFLSLDAV